jgi:hypothetical protein
MSGRVGVGRDGCHWQSLLTELEALSDDLIFNPRPLFAQSPKYASVNSVQVSVTYKHTNKCCSLWGKGILQFLHPVETWPFRFTIYGPFSLRKVKPCLQSSFIWPFIFRSCKPLPSFSLSPQSVQQWPHANPDSMTRKINSQEAYLHMCNQSVWSASGQQGLTV